MPILQTDLRRIYVQDMYVSAYRFSTYLPIIVITSPGL